MATGTTIELGAVFLHHRRLALSGGILGSKFLSEHGRREISALPCLGFFVPLLQSCCVCLTIRFSLFISHDRYRAMPQLIERLVRNFTGSDPLSSNPVGLLDVLLKVNGSYTPQPLATNLDPSQLASLQQHPHCWQANA